MTASGPPPARSTQPQPTAPFEARRCIRVPRITAWIRTRRPRERRHLAREIFGQDPALAADLGIGRPDLGRGYDDGGLVDVNTAPSVVPIHGLGMVPTVADQVVTAREAAGGFTSIEELVVVADLDLDMIERLRERIVLSPR